jgi:hypothetical protein
VSITFGELKTTLASRLSDPDGDVFTDAILAELVNEALAEVGRYAPAMFTEDITLVEDTLSYIIRSDVFNGEATPEIELTRVELWDGDQTPPVIVYSILPAHAETSTRSDLGWTNWGGTLYLPNFAHTIFDGHEDTYFLRIYGYSPYVPLAEDEDVSGVSNEVKWALMTYAQLEATQRLVNDRTLFKQWQTRAGNSDISAAGLMNEMNLLRDEWRRRSRAITRLRSGS